MVSQGRRYEIEAPVGKGGFGTVYRARFVGEGGFSKVVALKVLNRNMADLEEVLARLRDEARLLGLLRHRAVVRADRLVRLADRWAVVMEYVEGVDLKRVLAHTQVPPGVAVEILAEVAGALHAAWNTPGPDGSPLHLIHRDIKPSNIVLTAYGELKVLDFGIARADFGGREAETKAYGMGSLPYMAPERLDFRDTAAADVYALGVVFFELVTGRAFGRASANPERHRGHVDAALRFLVEHGLSSRDMLLFLEPLLAYEPEDRPDAGRLERMCVNLRRRLEDEPLRYWAERVVPQIMAEVEQLPPDEMTGSSLVEQTEGTLSAGALTSGELSPLLERPAGDTSGAGVFAALASEAAASSLGSGAFSTPASAAAPSSGSGAFSAPVAATRTRSAPSSLPAPPTLPPPAPPVTASLPPAPPAPPPVVAPASAVTPTPVPAPAPPPPAEEPLAEQDTPTSPGGSRRTGLGRGLIALGLVAFALLALLVGSLALWAVLEWRAPASPTPPPQPILTEPTPAGSEVKPPQPEVKPVKPPQPEVKPVEPPQPEVKPVEPPEPEVKSPVAGSSRPRPEPESGRRSASSAGSGTADEAPPPQDATRGRVELSGDAEQVVLVRGSNRFTLPASVPEGTYQIIATFPNREPMGAGTVSVRAGQTVTVNCSAGFTQCRPR